MILSKARLLVFSIGLLSITSCLEKRAEIKNSDHEIFSDLIDFTVSNSSLFNNHKNFPVSITNNDFSDHNSILFLTESTNMLPIGKENLEKLLPENEFNEWINNACELKEDSLICSKEYFAYGRIVKPDYVLLEYGIREYGDWGRHYVFELRTYKPNGELISKIDFAKWSDRDNEFFEGKLTEDMHVEVYSKGKNIAQYNIDENGSISKNHHR